MTNHQEEVNTPKLTLRRSPAFAAPVLASLCKRPNGLTALTNEQIAVLLAHNLSTAVEPRWMQTCTPDARQSAVLIVLIGEPFPKQVLFTMRVRGLSSHAGQISFPGGRVESGDASLIATALREAHEEIGLDSQQVSVLGMMPTLYAHTGYLITPIVATIATLPVLSLQAREVDHAFTVPFDFLCDPKNHRYCRLTRINSDKSIRHSHTYTMHYGDWDIWGLSALIVRRFYAVLSAR